MFGHHEQKCMKSKVCRKCGDGGADHIELSGTNQPKCANCQGDHHADSRDCMIWKKEKELNRIKYTNNLSFPEARRIVQNSNNFLSKSYSDATKQNVPTKDHSCKSCHSLLEKLAQLTPHHHQPVTPQSVSQKSTSQSTSQPIEPIQSASKAKPSTQSTQTFLSSTKTVQTSTTTQKKPTLPVETPNWTPPPLQNGTTKSPYRDGFRSPLKHVGRVLRRASKFSWRKPTQKIHTKF